MTKKILGYVELEWTCPNCHSKNPGTTAVCQSCGAPQPADVQFEQPAQEVLLTQPPPQAASAPDIHCAYCGTRNPAGSQTCASCGADLSEGTARQQGQVLGTHRPQAAPDVICPACGSANPATARRCSQCNTPLRTEKQETAVAPHPPRKPNPLVYALIGLALFACLAFAFMLFRTEEVIGQVSGVQWTRTIAIEERGPVEYRAWRDQIPASAEIGRCEQRVRTTQSNPAPNAVEVCGTPYTIDTGSGLGQVVQDCYYEVYDDFCRYTVLEWREVDKVTTSASDYAPYWPELRLRPGQREGARQESYEIRFNADGDRYTYTTSSLETFMQCRPNSEWVLEVNTFKTVRAISPAR